jgi:hypothetical protein
METMDDMNKNQRVVLFVNSNVKAEANENDTEL